MNSCTVRRACNWVKRVRSAAVVRFFERHVVEFEKQLRMGDRHGFFQNIKIGAARGDEEGRTTVHP